MTRARSIILCAVEPSGDALGAALFRSLRECDENLQISGVGGPAMAKAGLTSLFDMDALSVMGPSDALRVLPRAANSAWAIAQHAADRRADAAIFIDAWGFSRLAAGKLAKISPQTRCYKYVAPQVWASRPERAHTLGRLFNGVVTLFDFEPPWFEEKGVRAFCAGHPGFQRLKQRARDGAGFRDRSGLGDRAILILAPGSRRSEIKWLSRPFREAGDILRAQIPGLAIVIPAAPGRDVQIRDGFGDWSADPLVIAADEKYDAFDAGDAALVASGTASTELAICNTPMVVGYAADRLTAAWARRVVTTPHASLVNIAAGREIIPEFIQEACTGPALAAALAPLLARGPERTSQLTAFPEALSRLGATGNDAAERAAQTFLCWIDEDCHR